MVGEIESDQFVIPAQQTYNSIDNFVASTWARSTPATTGSDVISSQSKQTSEPGVVDFDQFPLPYTLRDSGTQSKRDTEGVEAVVGAELRENVGSPPVADASREVAHIDKGAYSDMDGLLKNVLNRDLLGGESPECIRKILEYRLKTGGHSEADKLGKGLTLDKDRSLQIRLDAPYEDAVIAKLKSEGKYPASGLDLMYIRVAELKDDKGKVISAIGLVGVYDAVTRDFKTPLAIYPVEYGPRLPKK